MAPLYFTEEPGGGLPSKNSNSLSFCHATTNPPSQPPNKGKQTKINIDNEDVYVNVEDSNNNSLDMASFTNDPTTFIPNAMDPMGTAPIIEDHINAMRVLNLIPLMVIKPHVKTTVDPTKDKGVALMNIVTSALETDIATRKSPNSPRNQEVFTHGGTFQDQKDLPLQPSSNNKVGMSSDKNSPAHQTSNSLSFLIGTINKIDTCRIDENMTSYLGVGCTIDITKPLRRYVAIGGSDPSPRFCSLQYEQLPTLCYGCGFIGHLVEVFPVVKITPNNKLQYEEWLRYISPRSQAEASHPKTQIHYHSATPQQIHLPNHRTKINIDNEDVYVNVEDSNNNSLDMASFTNDPTTFIPNAMDPMGTAPIIEDHINAMRVLNLIPLMVIKPHVKTAVDPTKDKGVALMNIVTSALETDMATRKSPNSPRNQEVFTHGGTFQDQKDLPLPPASNNKVGMSSDKNSPAQVDVQPR
ncbi:hypothetical protein V6N12_065363 [Hibiscus sabdariffa]|uniref:Zinc knuckle CX2CX4HX4C domain-containing protein n=1 Tax=Hibiscus sabdariffa TaxID=183260 RepID=A0ABR2G9I2_9ROSI